LYVLTALLAITILDTLLTATVAENVAYLKITENHCLNFLIAALLSLLYFYSSKGYVVGEKLVVTLNTGVSKLRPAGQIQPVKPFHPAREDIQ